MMDNLAEIVLAFPSSSGKRSAFRGSLDIRDKPEYDIKKNKPEQDYKEK